MGQDASCFRNHWFNMTCHESDTLTPPKALLLDTFEVLDISLQGQLRIKFPITWVCYYQYGIESKSDEGHRLAFEETPYTFSNTHNKFTAIGCDTHAYAKGLTNTGVFESGCISYCSDTNNVINGSCTGIGCCQSSIQAGLQPLKLIIRTIHNHSNVWSFNPCSYAALADQDFNFNFSVSDLLKTNFLDRNEKVPAVVDWMAEWNETCQEATRNKADYACLSENSECYDITINGPGYSCKCSPGYQGNPFVPGGCQGIGSILLFLLFVITWTSYLMWRKMKSIKHKEKFFQQNGGLLLRKKICSRKGNTFKIFTIEELKKATNNYNASTVVGEGGYGIKSKLVDASQIEQFINELDILSQTNHKNVVKLLGCCLEDQVPILVYEFVSNGTLYHHIHMPKHFSSISLENWIRIAAETAEALAYLHSATSTTIVHRDVKSSNILLDYNFTAKVSDFGVSRLVSIDQTQITTLMQELGDT
ncbi:putative wall-associated receptor kinase-like protein 16 [Cinnamomum micranthum f. kanehirae]|uniref:Putative wall-associated receptor kinase-like protein 16 n=1 Tax=Cinnamomum micranthum f. kanehirae TaxID=337451 RepID=A0A3S3PW27_9MAGN|nr:putative wall-associated receptor kinase-like protein 16 [Cinnamomum micranthum f. kanehirae]